MPKYALISGDVMVGLVNSPHDAAYVEEMTGCTLVENADAQADWIYDPENGTVNPPPPPVMLDEQQQNTKKK